nr:hypothetical protein [Phocaeicola sartorii]
MINGKRQKYIVGRKSDLAAEIIAKGRNKMPTEDKKALVERLLLPLARRITRTDYRIKLPTDLSGGTN